MALTSAATAFLTSALDAYSLGAAPLPVNTSLDQMALTCSVLVQHLLIKLGADGRAVVALDWCEQGRFTEEELGRLFAEHARGRVLRIDDDDDFRRARGHGGAPQAGGQQHHADA